MRSLVLAVLQSDADADLAAARAALPEADCWLVRPPDLAATAVPPDVAVLTAPVADRAAVAALVRRAATSDTVVVLDADERASAELRGALASLGSRPPGAYRVRRVHRFLGRDVAGEPVVIAWRGASSGAPVNDLPGVLTVLEADITTTVARVDARASRAAAEHAPVGFTDLATRPVAHLMRRLAMRRKDGVPGLILSVLEGYGVALVVAKAWERRSAPSSRRTSLAGAAIPSAFFVIETRRGYVVAREGTSRRLVQAVLDATPERVDGDPLGGGGRGTTWALADGDRGRAVLRWYRRGGAVRHLVHDRYLGWRARPIKELLVTEEARRRGVAAAEVLAARVDRLPGGLYRGAIVTREIAAAETLADVLQRRLPANERRVVIETVARAVATMHDGGVHHRDLNAANILVRRERGEVAVHLIDFDRARLGAIAMWRRRRALRRLARSLAKLDPEGVLVTAEDRAAFHQSYWGRR